MNIDKTLIENIIDSLGELIDYADDGMIPRDDPMYSEFFEAIDRGNELIDKLNKMIGDE